MNVKALVLAAALVIPQAAHAEWFVIDSIEHSCRPATTTPLEVEQKARKAGGFRDTQVARAADGTVDMVTVRIGPEGRGFIFMRDMGLCNFVLRGLMGTKDDLD